MSDTDTTDTDTSDRTDDAAIELIDSDRYRNGDETAILLGSLGDGYQALAVEINASGEILATEEIGHAEDRQKAEGMCQYWRDQNPKGILGGAEDGGGLLDSLGFGGEAS